MGYLHHIAARRGHDVQLLERDNELGGQLRIAHVPPGKAEIKPFLDYLIRQTQKLGVKIQTAVTVDLETIRQRSPDAVIVATGSVPLGLTGGGGGKVDIASAWDVLRGKANPGERVVVAGGGATGCEVAEHLRAQGKDVTIVERGHELARDMNPLGEGVRHFMIERLQRDGVKFMLEAEFLGVDGAGVSVKDKEGATVHLNADTLVTSFGVSPNRDFTQAALNAFVPEAYLVGDCVKPGNLLYATRGAAIVALQL